MVQAGAYLERFPRGARGEESRPEGGWGRKIFDFLTSLDAFSGHFLTIFGLRGLALLRQGVRPPLTTPLGVEKGERTNVLSGTSCTPLSKILNMPHVYLPFFTNVKRCGNYIYYTGARLSQIRSTITEKGHLK